MKILINTVLLSVLLTGCSLWPRAHDPALAQSFVTVKQDLQEIDCTDTQTTGWNAIVKDANWLREYTEFRNDPQKESAAGLVADLTRARGASSAKVCGHWLELSKKRLDVLNKAWSGR